MKSYAAAGILSVLGLASPISRQQSGQNQDISHSLQNVLDNTHRSDAYSYPTDFTRGIIPKPIHSHNDYWRDIPFYTALSVGCISVEADVWLYNDTLYVGHEESSLTESRTFDTLYVQPILDTLKRENPSSIFVDAPTRNGVFDTSAETTLYLWVDVKTEGAGTWPVVVEALQPLRDAGFLTSVNDGVVTQGAVTVIGTGNTPLNQIQGVGKRDYFFDANLALLNSTQSNITADVSPIASADFISSFGKVVGSTLNEAQLQLLRSQLAHADSKGIGGRYWDTPAWPVSTRNAVWQTLIDEGVALLNADDLAAAAGFGGPAAW